MVARLLRLRVALALAPLRRGIRDSLLALLVRLLYVVLAVVVAAAPVMFARDDEALLAGFDTVLGAVILLLALLLPAFVPQVSLDARAFQQFPLTPSKLALSLLGTSPVTWGGLAGAAWLAAYVVMRIDLVEWNARSTLAVIAIALSAPVLSRFGSSLSALLVRSPRLATIQRGFGVLLLVATLPVVTLMVVSTLRSDGNQQLDDAAQFFAWTPFGAPFAAFHGGPHTDVAVLQLGLQFAVLSLLVGAILSFTTEAFHRVHRPSRGAMLATSLGWFDYLPLTPAMSIGARSLTYWFRDPRYVVSLIAIPVIPVLVVGVLLVAGVAASSVAIIPLPLVLIMIGWMIHNDVATDSTAFWIHVASGIRGVQDRVGRIVPVFVLGIPVLIIGTSATVLLMGQWQEFPVVFAIGFVALCASAAVSSVISVAKPYPTTRPGESPFVQPAWHGTGSGFAQTTSLLGSAALVTPVIWIVFAQPDMGLAGSMILLLLSLMYGALILVGGLTLGGRIYDRRSSELLAFTQEFD